MLDATLILSLHDQFTAHGHDPATPAPQPSSPFDPHLLAPSAPLHSESPGLIIDRLSILALKIFHTESQLHRSTPEHQHRNHLRLLVLNEQRTDLSGCLADLWKQVLTGERRFKIYRQLKMYNDPTLNPVLYRRSPP
jgi:hypothetical protein